MGVIVFVYRCELPIEHPLNKFYTYKKLKKSLKIQEIYLISKAFFAIIIE